MDSAKLNDWLQIIGLFGVIAGLFFVGLQMRQDQKIAMPAAYQARADTTIDLLLTNSENPVLLAAQNKWAAGHAESRTAVEVAGIDSDHSWSSPNGRTGCVQIGWYDKPRINGQSEVGRRLRLGFSARNFPTPSWVKNRETALAGQESPRQSLSGA